MAEGNVAADQLRLFNERIERLEEEKKGIADDVRDVYSEAKSNGYDTKTMRAIVRLRKMESHARQEADALLETYRNALGLGVDIETGGHVFQLHLTNSKGMVEKFFVPQTDGNFFDGDIYFGFTVARNFTIKSQL